MISFSFANENDIYDPYPITGSGDFVRVKNDLQFNEADTYVLVYESSDSTAVAFSGMKQKNSRLLMGVPQRLPSTDIPSTTRAAKLASSS